MHRRQMRNLAMHHSRAAQDVSGAWRTRAFFTGLKSPEQYGDGSEPITILRDIKGITWNNHPLT